MRDTLDADEVDRCDDTDAEDDADMLEGVLLREEGEVRALGCATTSPCGYANFILPTH